MAVKVDCNRCQSSATIQSSYKKSDEVKVLYCTCDNPECGHSFAVDLSFSHTLSPSALDFPENFLTKIKSGTRQKDMQRMLNRLSVPDPYPA